MRRKFFLHSAALVCGLALLVGGASAQTPDGSISAGYSNIQFQRADNVFYNHNGAYVDGNFEFPITNEAPLLVGFGITGSGYWDDQRVPYTNNGFNGTAHLFSNTGLFEIEPRIGFRFGGETGFFATPRIGAGLLIDSYSIDQASTVNGQTYLDTQCFTGTAFEVRPAVQAGYSWGYASAGIEGSYLWAWGNFGSLGREAQEFRVGAFVQFRF